MRVFYASCIIIDLFLQGLILWSSSLHPQTMQFSIATSCTAGIILALLSVSAWAILFGAHRFGFPLRICGFVTMKLGSTLLYAQVFVGENSLLALLNSSSLIFSSAMFGLWLALRYRLKRSV